VTMMVGADENELVVAFSELVSDIPDDRRAIKLR
jgi:hypothetical protein